MLERQWESLKSGDTIQLIAPASVGKYPIVDFEGNYTEYYKEFTKILSEVKELIEKWGLKVKISDLMIGKNKKYPSVANTKKNRRTDLINAIQDPNVHAIWCIWGGYGSSSY